MSWLRSFFAWLSRPFQPPQPTPDALLTGAESAGAAEAPAGARRWRRVLLWTLHVLLVVLIVLLLWYLNHVYDLGRALRAPWRPLSAVWLPALFLLFYALCWLGWWLWRLLGPEKPSGAFADIEDAWAAAVRDLKAAGIALADAPLFLVLGRPAAPFPQFFAASRLPLQVRHAPNDPKAPLHVYANREAIYVTCAGASLLGEQSALLTEAPEEAPPPVEVPLAPLFGAGPEQSEAPAVGSAEQEVETASAATGVLLLGEVGTRPKKRGAPPALLKNAKEVQRQSARLRHLCKLLLRDRQPYCPVNGVLVLLPLAATDSADDASQTGAVCRHDLGIVREALCVDCPRWAVLCDMERLPGFTDLVGRHPEAQGTGKGAPAVVLGRHFPLAPDVPAAEWPGMVESGVAWLADNLLPLVVYKMLGAEGDLGANSRLFALLSEGRERLRRLGRLLSRGVLPEGTAAPLFGGCYLAATGPDANREQAFLAGVFRRALEGQNFVAWTPEGLAEDADYRRWAVVGWLGLLLFVGAMVWLVLAWARS